MNQDYSSAFQWPIQTPEIRDSLLAAFESGHWGKYEGDNCKRLTAELAQQLNLSMIRLCSSGTVAVEIALVATGIRPGDEVVIAGYDFPGNFRAIESVGGIPVLADIDPDSWCIDPDSMEASLSDRTKAVIVSHLHGGVADIERISTTLKSREIWLIEDICQCPGAQWNKRPLGSVGDICAMSFGGSKLLSAGRGGAIGTDNETLWQRAKIFCERGNDAFPLSELQAAALLPQLTALDELAERRNRQVEWLLEQLEAVESVTSVRIPPESRPDFYKVPLRLSTSDRKQDIIDQLRAKGIVIDHGFSGFTNRTERRCRKPVELENAKAAAANTLVLHHPCLLTDDFEKIVQEVIDVIKNVV